MSETETAARTMPITAGEDAPDFTLPAVVDGGEQIDVHMAEVWPKGRVLLVFYQDDGMPICTSELKAFAQEYDLLHDAGVQVYAINSNGLGSHAKFHERDHYPFPLISDFYGDAIKAYGLWDKGERKSARAAVIIGTDGKVEHVVPHFNPGNIAAFEEIFAALGLV
jgi:peroxiredoxin Q/BCP